MKKRILALLLATTMICGLFTACGEGNNSADNSEVTQNENSQQDTQKENISGDALTDENVKSIFSKMLGNCPEDAKYACLKFEGIDAMFILYNSILESGYLIFKEDESVASRYGSSGEVKFTKESIFFRENSYENQRMNFCEGYDENGKDEFALSYVYILDEDGSIVSEMYNMREFIGEETKDEEYTKEEYEQLMNSYTWYDFKDITDWYTTPFEAYENVVLFN